MTTGTLLLALLLQLLVGGGRAQGGGGGGGKDALLLGDALEFAAIRAIHVQLDDNADGSLDFSESDEFVQKELCGGEGGDGGRAAVVGGACLSSDKSQRFHQTDQLITSEELWSSWHRNEVFDWSTEDVLNWLQSTVKLPQYAPSFRSLRITGRHLPKIASNEGQILQSVLGIFDSQHKQKIQLRAMDIVLFGPPVKESSLWKDLVVLSSILICVIGLLYVLRQRRHTQSKIDSFLEDLHTKEEELAKLKEKLSLQEMVSECVDAGEGDSPAEDITSSSSSPEQPGSPQTEDDLISEMSISSHDAYTHVQQAREEVGHYQRKVLSLEVQLERSRLDHKTLHELLLQAYRNERQHLDFRKKIAEDEMNRAQKVCDRIKKRRNSLLGSFHLANSSALEDAGMQITKAVNKMHTVAECFDEYHVRWRKIETACCFTITSSHSSPTTLTPPHPPHTLFSSHTDTKYKHRHLADNASEMAFDVFSTERRDQLEWLRQDSNSSSNSSQSARFSKRVNSLPDIRRSSKASRGRPPSTVTSSVSGKPPASLGRGHQRSHDLGSERSADVHPVTEPLRRASYSSTSVASKEALAQKRCSGSTSKLLRKESYSEAIESTDAATTLEGEWISFSTSEKRGKRNSLGVIKEEGRAGRLPNGGESHGEDSDHSTGSERRHTPSTTRKLRVSHSSDV